MNNKDWTGDKNSIYKTLGASNHTDEEREPNDYCATDPKAIDILCEYEEFNGSIWECAAGSGHMSKRLIELGYDVISTDLIDRGYCMGGVDFLKATKSLAPNIITNPPYKYLNEFMLKAMEILPMGGKLALFLKVQHLSSQERKKIYKSYPPVYVYISSSRILCAKNADFDTIKNNGGSAVDYMWVVWVKGYTGATIMKWIN